MADFCKQCSIDLWGEDFGDLAGLGKLPPDRYWSVICEGCGFILVNEAGECVECDLHPNEPGHGSAPK